MIEPWADLPLNEHTGLPMSPRAWQVAAIPAAINAVRNRNRPLLSVVTGGGKSTAIAELCRLAEAKAKPSTTTIVTTPTQALVEQLYRTISRRCRSVGRYYGRVKEPLCSVVVTCNPSAVSLAAELKANGRRAGLVQVDEAHKSESTGMLAAVEKLRPTGLVGWTGTPYRSAEHESLSLWDVLAMRYTFADALRDGVLVPYRPYWLGSQTETTALDEVCLSLMLEHGSEGRGITSAKSILDAEQHAEWLCSRGVPAAAIHSKNRSTHDDVLRRLRTGDLQYLVHVSLLAEGVDIPWLLNLCLRRLLGARVMLAQQVGRVLRTSPGKTHANILDPHNLLATLRITHPAQLGEALEEALEPDERGPGTGIPAEVILPPATIVDESTQWTQLLLLRLQCAGIVDGSEIDPGFWRHRRPNQKQMNMLKGLKRWTQHLPVGAAEVVGELAKPAMAEQLSRGAVSDLISVLMAVQTAAPPRPHGAPKWMRTRRGWRLPLPEGFELPVLQGEISAGIQGLIRDDRNTKARAKRAAAKVTV